MCQVFRPSKKPGSPRCLARQDRTQRPTALASPLPLPGRRDDPCAVEPHVGWQARGQGEGHLDRRVITLQWEFDVPAHWEVKH